MSFSGPSFWPSAERQQHAFVDDIRQRTIDFLSERSVKQMLRERVDALGTIAEGLYAPNIRHGVISIPKEYQDTDNTPAVSLRPGKVLRSSPGFSLLTPTQRQHFLDKLEAQNLEGHTPEEFLDAWNKKLLTMPSLFEIARRDWAAVESRGGEVEFGKTSPFHWGVKGQPLLIFNKSKGRIGLPALMHEFTHVKQAQDQPAIEFDSVPNCIASRELEGHFVGALVLPYIMETRSYEPSSIDKMHLRVDGIRRKFAHQDRPFEITEAMHAAFKDYPAEEMHSAFY